MSKENLYLVCKHYGIAEDTKGSGIIANAAYISYLDFCRRLFFQDKVPVDVRSELQNKTIKFFSEEIPLLFEITNGENNGQERFDKKHHEICESIIGIYEDTGGQSYGIVQQWLNLTLMNLVVIESALETGYWPIMDARKYFHVPVDQYSLEVATSKKGGFKHGLKLKYAPLRHDTEDDYRMDWYSREETQPPQYWGYPEYMEFQIALRNKLKECSTDSREIYQDCLAWAFLACTEQAKARYCC